MRKFHLFGMTALLCALLFVLGCDNGSTTPDNTATYTGTDTTDGSTYTLTITAARYVAKADDDYRLVRVSGSDTKTSTGKVEKVSGTGADLTFELTPKGGGTITTKVSPKGITGFTVTDTVTWDDDGGKLELPETVTPSKEAEEDEDDDPSEALIAKWYGTQADANSEGTVLYEFASDGKIGISGSFAGGMTYTASGGTITVKAAGQTLGTATYTITGTELTLSNVGNSGLAEGTYYKKAQNIDSNDDDNDKDDDDSDKDDDDDDDSKGKDALTWKAVTDTSFSSDEIYGIAYGNGKFVAVGKSGQAAYSTDGEKWEAVTDAKFDSTYIRGIAYGGPDGQKKFVAVGNSGKAAYSTDGETWEAVDDTTFNTYGTHEILGIVYGNDRFVAVGGSGTAAWSTDGVEWTAVANTKFKSGRLETIRGIAYGNGTFVAVGSSGQVAWSTDGVDWTQVIVPGFIANNNIYGSADGIAYGGAVGKEKFVAVGQRAAYSEDGKTWTQVTDTTLDSYLIYGIAYGGGKFVAGGDTDQVVYSEDGVKWTAVDTTLGVHTDINGIAYGGGKFVAVGGGKDDSSQNVGKIAYSNKQE